MAARCTGITLPGFDPMIVIANWISHPYFGTYPLWIPFIGGDVERFLEFPPFWIPYHWIVWSDLPPHWTPRSNDMVIHWRSWIFSAMISPFVSQSRSLAQRLKTISHSFRRSSCRMMVKSCAASHQSRASWSARRMIL